eukprot:4982704-Amphidinium_carterae.1
MQHVGEKAAPTLGYRSYFHRSAMFAIAAGMSMKDMRRNLEYGRVAQGLGEGQQNTHPHMSSLSLGAILPGHCTRWLEEPALAAVCLSLKRLLDNLWCTIHSALKRYAIFFADVCALVRQVGIQQDAQVVMNLLDLDQNGDISYTEFLAGAMQT